MESEESSSGCFVCQHDWEQDNPDCLLCESANPCGLEFHVFCLDPPLMQPPEESRRWLCPACHPIGKTAALKRYLDQKGSELQVAGAVQSPFRDLCCSISIIGRCVRISSPVNLLNTGRIISRRENEQHMWEHLVQFKSGGDGRNLPLSAWLSLDMYDCAIGGEIVVVKHQDHWRPAETLVLSGLALTCDSKCSINRLGSDSLAVPVLLFEDDSYHCVNQCQSFDSYYNKEPGRTAVKRGCVGYVRAVDELQQRLAARDRAVRLRATSQPISDYRSEEELNSLVYEVDERSDLYKSLDYYNQWLYTKNYVSAGNIVDGCSTIDVLRAATDQAQSSKRHSSALGSTNPSLEYEVKRACGRRKEYEVDEILDDMRAQRLLCIDVDKAIMQCGDVNPLILSLTVGKGIKFALGRRPPTPAGSVGSPYLKSGGSCAIPEVKLVPYSIFDDMWHHETEEHDSSHALEPRSGEYVKCSVGVVEITGERANRSSSHPYPVTSRDGRIVDMNEECDEMEIVHVINDDHPTYGCKDDYYGDPPLCILSHDDYCLVGSPSADIVMDKVGATSGDSVPYNATVQVDGHEDGVHEHSLVVPSEPPVADLCHFAESSATEGELPDSSSINVACGVLAKNATGGDVCTGSGDPDMDYTADTSDDGGSDDECVGCGIGGDKGRSEAVPCQPHCNFDSMDIPAKLVNAKDGCDDITVFVCDPTDITIHQDGQGNNLREIPPGDRLGRLVRATDESGAIGEIVYVANNGYVRVRDPWGDIHCLRSSVLETFDVYSEYYEVYTGMLKMSAQEIDDVLEINEDQLGDLDEDSVTLNTIASPLPSHADSLELVADRSPSFVSDTPHNVSSSAGGSDDVVGNQVRICLNGLIGKKSAAASPMRVASAKSVPEYVDKAVDLPSNTRDGGNGDSTHLQPRPAGLIRKRSAAVMLQGTGTTSTACGDDNSSRRPRPRDILATGSLRDTDCSRFARGAGRYNHRKQDDKFCVTHEQTTTAWGPTKDDHRGDPHLEKNRHNPSHNNPSLVGANDDDDDVVPDWMVDDILGLGDVDPKHQSHQQEDRIGAGNQSSRSSLCRYHLRGRCRYGTSCPHRH